MTTNEIMKLAKKSSCTCTYCNCTTRTTDGRPVFGNDSSDCKIADNGNTYCYLCARRLERDGSITLVTIPDWTENDRVSDRDTVLFTIKEMKQGEKFSAYEKNEHVTARCIREDNTIFVYAHRKHRYGYRYSFSTFADKYDLKDVKSKAKLTATEEWHKRITKVVKCLEKSGLWPELLVKFKNMLTMTWEDRDYIRLNYEWGKDNTYLITMYKKKYPFLFRQTENGSLILDTEYTYEMSNVILKSMYFGKYWNADIKKTIAEKIASKEDYKCSRQVNYDVSFSYNAEANKAWYSEEYRGCGNGHYYLALDNNTALFYEDD